MRRKAYSAIAVKHVLGEKLAQQHPGEAVVVGTDIGKFELTAICWWAKGQWERPWRVGNPTELGEFVGVLQELRQGRQLVVAMEPSGTYGDALRQALDDAQIEVCRVSPKAAHDYAEIFDGVPSQHDGKDAAVVAELAALGKSVPWPYQATAAWEQELTYWVDWMVAQRQVLAMWQGRLEGLLARHWPEATRVLKLSSVTLLKVLAHYGSPQSLAGDPEAAARLAGWGGKFLDERKIERLLADARASAGVRAGEWARRRLQDFAREALQARRQGEHGQRRLRVLARGQRVLEAQGRVVGVPTACVLWVSTGDPRKYYAAAAYRKAMGLNLVERSSGDYQGSLHISKRGSACTRQWLYFAVLRLVQKAGVRPWYEAKKARDPDAAKSVLVALMRKLALALYQVGVHEQTFDPQRLFAKAVSRVPTSSEVPAARGVSVEA
jgi:transposase